MNCGVTFAVIHVVYVDVVVYYVVVLGIVVGVVDVGCCVVCGVWLVR